MNTSQCPTWLGASWTSPIIPRPFSFLVYLRTASQEQETCQCWVPLPRQVQCCMIAIASGEPLWAKWTTSGLICSLKKEPKYVWGNQNRDITNHGLQLDLNYASPSANIKKLLLLVRDFSQDQEEMNGYLIFPQLRPVSYFNRLVKIEPYRSKGISSGKSASNH